MLRKFRGHDWVLGLAPQELAGRPEGVIFTAICLVAIGLITAADFVTPRIGSVAPLELLPVAAAAWLVSRRLALVVVFAAIASSLLEAKAGIVPPLTAAARLSAIPLLGLLSRIAATSVLGRQRVERNARDLRALERAKGDFLRLASHELRSPVAVLRGYLSMLEDGSLGGVPPALGQVLPVLVATAAGMNRIVDQMLDVARLEDSRLQLRLTRVDLTEVIQEAVASAQLVHGGSHRVSSRLHAAPCLELDRTRVATILSNLITNAMKYSADGTEIVVALESNEREVVVSVTDHGIGMDESEQRILFTRFGRVASPDTAGIPGTGLGLYLSRELARLHGGDITVRSKRGEGSTFMLHLPRARPPAAAVRSAATPAPEPEARRRLAG